MPRGKKELTEQIIPYAASVEVEVGRGKTVAEAVSGRGQLLTVAADGTALVGDNRPSSRRVIRESAWL